jgi:hypothetical protein
MALTPLKLLNVFNELNIVINGYDIIIKDRPQVLHTKLFVIQCSFTCYTFVSMYFLCWWSAKISHVTYPCVPLWRLFGGRIILVVAQSIVVVIVIIVVIVGQSQQVHFFVLSRWRDTITCWTCLSWTWWTRGWWTRDQLAEWRRLPRQLCCVCHPECIPYDRVELFGLKTQKQLGKYTMSSYISGKET